MAKKSKKIEKETRRLIEGITDLVKKKGDRYKFKSGKKKQVKKYKKTCVHWIIRKGKENPLTEPDPMRPGYWKCSLCGASFPIKPKTNAEYIHDADTLLEDVNQMQFLSVQMGGDADDTKLLVHLKQMIPQFAKVQKNILKAANKRQQWEDRKNNTDAMDQFAGFSGAYRYNN